MSRAAVLIYGAVLAAVVSACDGGALPVPVPAPPAGGAVPITGSERLAWSQPASIFAALQDYRFDLFVDGVSTTLSDARCVENRATGVHACTAPLPPLTPGRHELQLGAVNRLNDRAGPRSASLTVTVAARTGRIVLEPSAPPPACTPPLPTPCWAATELAPSVAPTRRILPLPDGRLLLVHDDAGLTMLPSMTTDRLPLGRAVAGTRIDIDDVAASPDFAADGMVYFAVVATGADRRTVRVIRGRVVGDRVGEPAILVPDLPLAGEARPALTIGSDRHLYLALPAAPGRRPRDPYAGMLLRFSTDGRAAGVGASPVVALAGAEPAPMVWVGDTLLMLGGGASGPALLHLPIRREGARAVSAGTATAVTLHARPVADLAAGSTAAGATAVALIAGVPRALHTGRVTSGSTPRVDGLRPLVWPGVDPQAVAYTADGDIVVAIVRPPSAAVRIVRLRSLLSAEVGP